MVTLLPVVHAAASAGAGARNPLAMKVKRKSVKPKRRNAFERYSLRSDAKSGIECPFVLFKPCRNFLNRTDICFSGLSARIRRLLARGEAGSGPEPWLGVGLPSLEERGRG